MEEMFLEFNLPDPLKPHVGKIIRFKWVDRYELTEDKLKLIWKFKPEKLQEYINKLYQREYKKFNKRNTVNLSKIINKVLKENV